MLDSRQWRVILGIGAAWLAVDSARAQVPKGTVDASAPAPALQYHGLTPGLSTDEQVRKALGEPESEAKWYSWKMLYPVEGQPGVYDAIQLSGKGGRYQSCEAASIPEGYETKEAVRKKLGPEEFELLMPTFSMLDYTEKGVRFHFDNSGKTIGVAYVPHTEPRVHGGARKRVDLTHLRQGPQPKPKKPADLGALTAGAVVVKISPKKEWIDPRYQEKFQPRDDLFARIVVFERDGLAVALVGVDLFGLAFPVVEPILASSKQAGVDHVIIACSHNHAAPDTLGVYGHFPGEYLQFLVETITKGVIQAYQTRQPVAELRAASRELSTDGARVMGYFRNARNPGIIDPTVSILQPIGADGKPIATVVNFACHVEGIEAGVLEETADFPGYMCDKIAENGGGVPVFLNGAVGGMVSGDNKARTHEEAKIMGEGLAEIVRSLEEIAVSPETFQFSLDVRRVEIPLTNANLRERMKELRATTRGRVITQMALVRIGEAEILTLPGEVLPEVSFEILEQMKGFPRMLVGLANDQLGYIIPPYDFRDDEYEESMSCGPAAAPVVLDTAWRLLDQKPE